MTAGSSQDSRRGAAGRCAFSKPSRSRGTARTGGPHRRSGVRPCGAPERRHVLRGVRRLAGSRTLSERTIRDERAVARRYLAKLLRRRIQDVSVSDAAAVLHSNRHLAHWTRVHIYRILAGTFAHALRRGTVSRNPMDGISKAERPRQRNKRNIARLVSSDVDLLVAAASTARDRAAIGLASYAGLRVGEVRALHWSEVDFEAGTVTVLVPAPRTGRSSSRSQKLVSGRFRCCQPCERCSFACPLRRPRHRHQGRPAGAGTEPAPIPRRRQTAGGPRRHRGEAPGTACATASARTSRRTELPPTTVARIMGHADAGFTLRAYARDARSTADLTAEELAGQSGF